MLTVVERLTPDGIAPARPAHDRVKTVWPVIGLEVFAPADVLPETNPHRPVALSLVPSPLVPVTEHELTFRTSQLTDAVLPLRRRTG